MIYVEELEYSVPAVIFPGMDEYWAPINIIGVKPNLYELSTFGNCRNINTGKYLKPSIINSGYYIYKLYSGERRTTEDGRSIPLYSKKTIHRLMMSIFNPIIDQDLYTVNHKDGIKSHNWLWNLEWISQRDNNIHAYKNNLMTNKSMMFDDNTVRKICEYIQENPTASNREIFDATVGGHYATSADRTRISCIRNRKSFLSISKDYIW